MVPYVIAVLVGLIAGGIVNILADDLPYRRNPGSPRYPDGTPRPVSAWLGICAFLLRQREPAVQQPEEGRSRPHRNGNTLSWRHPLAELATIALMLMTIHATRRMEDVSVIQLAFYLIYMAIFVVITVIDLEHRLILFIVIVPSIALALVDSIVLPQTGPPLRDALAGAAFGFAVFFLFYLGGYAFNAIVGRMRGQSMTTVAFGYGDVMLITFSGAMLGVGSIFFTLIITAFLGAGGALIYIVVRRVVAGSYSAFAAIPYGPYIVAATIIMLLYSVPIQCYYLGYAQQGFC